MGIKANKRYRYGWGSPSHFTWVDKGGLKKEKVSWGHDINYHHLSYLVFWEFLSINIIWTPVQLNCWSLWPWRSLTSHSRMPLTKKTLSEGGVVVLCQNCISIQPRLSIWMLRQEQWIAVQRFRTHSPGNMSAGQVLQAWASLQLKCSKRPKGCMGEPEGQGQEKHHPEGGVCRPWRGRA